MLAWDFTNDLSGVFSSAPKTVWNTTIDMPHSGRYSSTYLCIFDQGRMINDAHSMHVTYGQFVGIFNMYITSECVVLKYKYVVLKMAAWFCLLFNRNMESLGVSLSSYQRELPTSAICDADMLRSDCQFP